MMINLTIYNMMNDDILTINMGGGCNIRDHHKPMSLPITSMTVVKSIWSFVQRSTQSLSYPVQNVKKIEQF